MAEQWQPAHTWAVIVGLLEWRHDDIYSPFPTDGRRDTQLADLLLQRGVPPAQLCRLHDRAATSAAITRRLREHLTAAPDNATLLVYYCGHGSLDEAGNLLFASYDADDGDNPGWAAQDLLAMIDRHFSGKQVLLLADCCHSGRLAELITGRRTRPAYAVLASSLASELSTGNWTFTEAVLAALRGEAYTDNDSNAVITLADLAAHVRRELVFAEEQLTAFAVSAGFDDQLILGTARLRRDTRIGRQVIVQSDGGWYLAQVRDIRGKQVRVHFYGYPDSDDEWVAETALRSVGRPRYPIGCAVEVKWQSRWYTATILDEQDGVHRIGYDGFGAEHHEWVSSQRIRPLG